MKKVILLSSTLLAAPFMFGETGEALAQCTTSTDCATLGYTSSSNTGNCIKCPVGTTWYCPPTVSTPPAKDCIDYKYTCTGANEVKPSSGACNGKYGKCDCASGYVWSIGTCILNCTPKPDEIDCPCGTMSEWNGCNGYRTICVQCTKPASYYFPSCSCSELSGGAMASGKATMKKCEYCPDKEIPASNDRSFKYFYNDPNGDALQQCNEFCSQAPLWYSDASTTCTERECNY